ncbi:uncharacterized protein LOC122655357 [Telopea speciosissima]|uniref:uncharacterized protein LOC122655357 n=1 Tax=Telopea speciosissima TaxID=54955 RepID=UPI001CC399C9|nr:uncharacterized protein LOC122655357 [Telopea speciosissima]
MAFENYEVDEEEENVEMDEENLAEYDFDEYHGQFDKEFNVNDDADVDFGLESVFTDVHHFRAALGEYAIRNGFDTLKTKNEKDRVTAICVADGCPWRIAQKLESRLRTEPDMKVKSMVDIIRELYGIKVGRMQCYKARLIVKGENEVLHKQQYAKLPLYAKLLIDRNPGTVCIINRHERHDFAEASKFKRVFICLDACKKGFINGCRPFIGLDDCHLKGRYGGILLSAISVDGNNGLFPIAYSVVEVENKDSWRWFLYNLEEALGSNNLPVGLIFMSDKRNGLQDALAEAATKVPNEFLFQKAMQKILLCDKEAHDWLMRSHLSTWSRHAFDFSCKSDHITNNMTESLNNWIGDVRSKPILSLIDEIRVKLMRRFYKRYSHAMKQEGIVTPSVQKIIRSINEQARDCNPMQASDYEFEVLEGRTQFVVHLQNRTCSCRVWEATGIPCKHVAACVMSNREDIHIYCDPCYSVERYKLAYREVIHPLTSLDEWEVVPGDDMMLPPPLKRQPGRPKKNKREPSEPDPSDFRRRSNTVRCDVCKQIGHNSRTCQGGAMKRNDDASGSQSQLTTQELKRAPRATKQARRIRRATGSGPTTGSVPAPRGRGASVARSRGAAVTRTRGVVTRSRRAATGRGAEVATTRGAATGRGVGAVGGRGASVVAARGGRGASVPATRGRGASVPTTRGRGAV